MYADYCGESQPLAQDQSARHIFGFFIRSSDPVMIPLPPNVIRLDSVTDFARAFGDRIQVGFILAKPEIAEAIAWGAMRFKA